MRLRILISAAIGTATGLLCWAVLARFQQSAGDFNWAIWAARDLLTHRNPYDHEMQLYHLRVAIFGLPFAWMRPEVAGGVFYELSSALMALGLSLHGYHRRLVFLAYPYWAGLIAVQWAPLLRFAGFPDQRNQARASRLRGRRRPDFPSDANRNRRDELGGRSLAVVSRFSQRYAGGELDCALHVSADAGDNSGPGAF